ncbi:MAG: sulfotransferase domain-containing protein [Pseudomonadota bacterium]
MARPDFLIIGAMKCGTSTLQAQLAAQDGIFMSTPKEPNFFSDDAIYAKGMEWYDALFEAAGPDDLKGEASTHYTKMPTHPDTVARLAKAVPEPKLIYVIRNPLERLVSHYIHDWTMGEIDVSLRDAVTFHPELVAYGRYAMQIAPYVKTFGVERIYLTSLEILQTMQGAELQKIAEFIGVEGEVSWQADINQMNASEERIRRFPLYDIIVQNPVATALRRTLVPRSFRDKVKSRYQMRERPELGEAVTRELAQVFSRDFAELRQMFPSNTAIETCANFETL